MTYKEFCEMMKTDSSIGKSVARLAKFTYDLYIKNQELEKRLNKLEDFTGKSGSI
jgi:hypothetical protein